MPWQKGIDIICKAYSKVEEEKLWQIWLVRYAEMTSDTFIPFSEFANLHKKKPKENQPSADELVKLAQQIRTTIESR